MNTTTPIRRLHHINFIYRNLENAVSEFEKTLGLGPFQFDQLVTRGVRTARIELDGVWLVIVSPVGADSAPARYLERFGEGFFLLSFEVDDLESALQQLDESTAAERLTEARTGLDNWKVVDLPSALPGLLLQLTDPRGSSR